MALRTAAPFPPNHRSWPEHETVTLQALGRGMSNAKLLGARFVANRAESTLSLEATQRRNDPGAELASPPRAQAHRLAQPNGVALVAHRRDQLAPLVDGEPQL